MKKTNLLLLLVTICIFGCKKEKELKSISDNIASESKLPEYNEQNTRKITWEQLPEKLKNARIGATQQAPSAINARFKFPIGPWGGAGGTAFVIEPEAYNDRIYAIAITSDVYVDGIRVYYQRPDGTLYYRQAGDFGGTFYITYFEPNEIIIAIGGRSGQYLNRLTIYTNVRTFSYGGTGGSPFYAAAGSGNQILGFFGGAGGYIDRIGANVFSIGLEPVINAVNVLIKVGSDPLADIAWPRLDRSTALGFVRLRGGRRIEINLNEGMQWNAGTFHSKRIPLPAGIFAPDIIAVGIQHLAAGPDFAADNWTMDEITISLIKASGGVASSVNLRGTPLWIFQKNANQIWQHNL